jgi:hypothetical protein
VLCERCYEAPALECEQKRKKFGVDQYHASPLYTKNEMFSLTLFQSDGVSIIAPVGNIGASKVVGRSKLSAASEYFIDIGVRTGTVVVASRVIVRYN